MLFNSIDFLVFFPIVVLIYWIIPKRIKYLWLLIASYYFYMCWNAKYAVLIATSTVITYTAALLIEKMQSDAGKKWIMALGFLSNLGILFFFKYLDFAILNLNRVLERMHMQVVSNPFSFLLPVGISFYTFQALGYMTDVYRGDCKAERNPLKYAFFVSFFPQLVAGPIERSKNLLSQIHEMDTHRLMSFEALSVGFAQMMWGFFMKMVISDRVALFVDEVFGKPYAVGSVEAILGAFGFALQIYCDFGGYSAIAIGAAKIMGFDLMENFNCPYFATSIHEFWRRWHISLSTWFRDYLYIPMGGSRCSKLRKYFNLTVTFLVSGLWHGAAWHYVAWGGLHALYQVAGDLTKPLRTKLQQLFHVKTEAFSFRLGQITGTFLLSSFAWIFFRAETMGKALEYFRIMVSRRNPWVLFDQSLYNWGLDRTEANILFVAVLLLFGVDIIREKKGQTIGVWLQNQGLLFRWLVMIVLTVAVIVYGEYGINFDSAQFIYFAF